MRQKTLCAVFVIIMAASLFSQVPSSKHIYVVALENTSYEKIVGSSNMPYLNSLFAKGALATQFYANRHTSITDYFLLTSGQVPSTNDYTTGIYDVDNMVRHLMRLGLTYEVTAQSLPYEGYAGSSSGAYVKRHTALPYYTDMGNSTTEMQKLNMISDLSADVQSSTNANFTMVTPDLSHDLHNCPSGLAACEQMADSFLKQYIAPLLATAPFQAGGDGVLVIWTDEGTLSSDNRCSATSSSGCGGRVAVAMIGPKVRAGYKSTTTYHHENLLRTMLEAFGDTSYPGLATSAKPMSDFFGASSGTGGGAVAISSPAAGATSSDPVNVVASIAGVSGVTAMKVYVDGVSKYQTSLASINTSLTLAAGTHSMTVKAWTSSGTVYSKSETFSVQ